MKDHFCMRCGGLLPKEQNYGHCPDCMILMLADKWRAARRRQGMKPKDEVYGATWEEIAEETGTNVVAARSTYYRALRKL